jgi:hypothetical protein
MVAIGFGISASLKPDTRDHRTSYKSLVTSIPKEPVLQIAVSLDTAHHKSVARRQN